MAIQINQVFKTQAGKLLKVKTIRESGIHTFVQIDENGNVIEDRKNSFGHVVDRSERLCSEETIRSFKQVKQ